MSKRWFSLEIIIFVHFLFFLSFHLPFSPSSYFSFPPNSPPLSLSFFFKHVLLLCIFSLFNVPYLPTFLLSLSLSWNFLLSFYISLSLSSEMFYFPILCLSSSLLFYDVLLYIFFLFLFNEFYHPIFLLSLFLFSFSLFFRHIPLPKFSLSLSFSFFD